MAVPGPPADKGRMMFTATNTAGARIRAAHPVNGTATNADCVARNAAAAIALEQLGNVSGARHWYTAKLSNGGIVGQWAESQLEAALEIAIWRNEGVVLCVIDDDCTLLRSRVDNAGVDETLFDLIDYADVQ